MYKNPKCKICNGLMFENYTGLVRSGSHPNYVDFYKIFRCNSCQLETLYDDKMKLNSRVDYESDDYRDNINQVSTLEDYQRNAKPLIDPIIQLIKPLLTPNSKILDVGCAGGYALNLLSDMGMDVAGVEPSESFRGLLKRDGYKVFKYLDDIDLPDGDFDFIISLHVIEHIVDPVKFITDCARLLKKGGKLIVATPNLNDILNKLECFKKFFYRTVHFHYFNEKSLTTAIKAAGLNDCSIFYLHRYPINNYFRWLNIGEPSKDASINYKNSELDKIWSDELQKNKLSDTLIAISNKS